MATWELYGGASDFRHHYNCDIRVSVDSDDATGALKGTISLNFGQMVFNVSGTWAAQGSVAGRANTVVCLSGPSADDAQYMVTLIGTCDGVDAANFKMDAMLAVASGTGGCPPTEPEYWEPATNDVLMKTFRGLLSGKDAVPPPH